MNNFEHFKKELKRDLMLQIMYNLKHGLMTKEDSRLLARDFLKAVDNAIDEQSTLSELFRFIEIHPEILSTFTKFANSYYEEQRKARLDQAQLTLKSGDVEAAVNILKGGSN